MRSVSLLCLGWVWLLAGRLEAAHTQASLLLQADRARPGDTILAGVHLKMDKGWHTYWKNSGAAGMPTEIDWKLPAGVRAGDIQWPVPEKLIESDLTTYIYKDETLLLVPLTLDPALPPGDLTLEASVSWLECEIQCIPGDAQVKAVLTISSNTVPSASAGLFDRWLGRLPQPGTNLAASASWGGPAEGDARPMVLSWKRVGGAGLSDFFPYASEAFELLGPTTELPTPAGQAKIRKVVKKSTAWPERISGVAIETVGAERRAFEITLAIEGAGAGAGPATAAGRPASSLWLMLLYAFVGGLILNVMPCVLPVIALKILGFVNQGKEHPGRVKALGLIYGVGVLVSFLALAFMVIAVKAAGQLAGWGMQFGNPQFLVVLTVLVTLVALNLFGLFEVTLGSSVMGAAGGLASKHGPAGAFFHGVLATILATPCTAPFLGAALGFAFAQPAPTIILIFLTVGAGLAFPYVLLSFQPAWLKFLPKPGAWMERFKIAMGFPMLATAVWLMSLIPLHYGERWWWLGLFLVFLALAAWILGEFYQRGRVRRGLGLGLALAMLLGGYLWAAERQLQWRHPPPPAETAAVAAASGSVAWEPWSPEAVEKARAAGRPVLVDFTAKWCLTCNTIVKPALENAAVAKRLKEINAVALLADYTRFPPRMTEELNRYGRAGVPLVLVYPPDPAQPALVLPEALTPGMVLDALNQAVGPAASQAGTTP